jgi:valyl-tRNA synthetase
MALTIGNTPGSDMNLDPKKVGAYKKFANKIWNISRFIIENHHEGTPAQLPDMQTGYLDELKHITAEVTTEIEQYRFYLAGEKLYHYLWHRVADEIIEQAKEVFASDEKEAKIAMSYALNEILTTSLKLLHPFMPFITETIWQRLPSASRRKDAEFLMVAEWPKE